MECFINPLGPCHLRLLHMGLAHSGTIWFLGRMHSTTHRFVVSYGLARTCLKGSVGKQNREHTSQRCRFPCVVFDICFLGRTTFQQITLLPVRLVFELQERSATALMWHSEIEKHLGH